MTTAPSHAASAWALAVRARHGTLSTLTAAGHPYGSLVAVALLDGAPILLLSGLAEHTHNLQRDGRCTLLLTDAAAEASPLAAGRVTLLGSAALVPDADLDAARSAFLSAHPEAAVYVGFRDFACWRLEVAEARYVGGFGRMSWLTGAAWSAAAQG